MLHLNPPGPPFHAWDNEEMEIPFKEKVPIESQLFGGLYYEVLDTHKKIFVIGFK